MTSLELSGPQGDAAATESIAAASWAGDLEALNKALSTLAPEFIAQVINGRNSRGQTALYCACRAGHLAIVKRLLELPGIQVNGSQEDSRASTPLHGAAWGGHKRVVAALLIAGADHKAMNSTSHRPFEEATPGVASMLRAFHDGGFDAIKVHMPKAKDPKRPTTPSLALTTTTASPISPLTSSLLSSLPPITIKTKGKASSWTLEECLNYVRQCRLDYLEPLYLKAIRDRDSLPDQDARAHRLAATASQRHRSEHAHGSLNRISRGSNGEGDPRLDFFELAIGKKGEITHMLKLKQASVEHLVEYLCLTPNHPLLPLWDVVEFIKSFFLSYRSFTTPKDLLGLLVAKFRLHYADTDEGGRTEKTLPNPYASSACRAVRSAFEAKNK